jgi:hypothetical protein
MAACAAQGVVMPSVVVGPYTISTDDLGVVAGVRGGAAHAYDLYINADTVENQVAAVDISITGLYQSWSKTKTGGDATPSEAVALAKLWTPERDSYAYVEFVEGGVLAETNDFVFGQDPPGGNTYDIEGNGTLSGARALTLAAMTQNLKLGRLVILDTVAVARTAILSGQLATGTGVITPLGEIALPIPEPATMALLAMGGLALIRRRR